MDADREQYKLQLAREARQLRLEQERIKERLHDIALELEGQDPFVWDEGGTTYRASTVFKTVLNIDQAKMQALDPASFEKYSVSTLSKPLVRKAIDSRRIKGWERYASIEAGEPYVSIKEIKDSSREENNDE